MNDNEFIAKVITDSRPAPQPTTSNTAHILLWCGFGAWLVAVVVTAAITFNNNQGPAYTTPSDPRTGNTGANANRCPAASANTHPHHPDAPSAAGTDGGSRTSKSGSCSCGEELYHP